MTASRAPAASIERPARARPVLTQPSERSRSITRWASRKAITVAIISTADAGAVALVGEQGGEDEEGDRRDEGLAGRPQPERGPVGQEGAAGHGDGGGQQEPGLHRSGRDDLLENADHERSSSRRAVERCRGSGSGRGSCRRRTASVTTRSHSTVVIEERGGQPEASAAAGGDR